DRSVRSARIDLDEDAPRARLSRTDIAEIPGDGAGLVRDAATGRIDEGHPRGKLETELGRRREPCRRDVSPRHRVDELVARMSRRAVGRERELERRRR